MSTGTHERPGLFARFRKPASVAEAPRAYPQESAFASEEPHGINGPEDIAAFLARTASGPPAEPWGPWDQPAGPVPHSEPETPLEYEYQRFYGWGLTLPDNRAPMAREYVPEPYTPDLCADLADLPAFRDALGRRTRCRAGECMCGHPVTGDTWGERMVRAGIHLFNSDTDQTLTAAPHLTFAAAAALSDESEAAA